MLKLTRASENPILTPTDNSWENMLVFNPAAVMKDGKVYVIYRAMGIGDVRSRLGLAISHDGIHFEREKHPMYYGGGHKLEELGVEDPRIVQIGSTYYITYTAVSEDLDVEIGADWKEQIAKKPRVALSTTKDFTNFSDYDVIIPDTLGKNASLFPKKINGEYWLLFRSGYGETFFANSPKLSYWPERYPVFDKREGYWDCKRVGIGAQPIETEKGWLLFYHGVCESNIYRLGIMLLDIDDPRKIIYRSDEPIFEPEKDYEKYGFIPNVVFTCGAVELDGKYWAYYGAADQVIGVATVPVADVMNLV